MKITIKQLTCKRCEHTWTPRKSEIRICPKCKSPYWDKERAGNNA
jgi:Zn finger protein HypA/HybF involved in hydrogenase expression